MSGAFCFLAIGIVGLLASGCGAPQGIHVYPGDDIQAAVDSAGRSSIRHVFVHEGTYRPAPVRSHWKASDLTGAESGHESR